MEHAPGRKFLKVVGILYIVAGAITILSMLQTLAFLLAPGHENLPDAADMLVLSYIALIQAVYRIVIGGMGVKHCDNREKAKVLLLLVVVDIMIEFSAFIWILFSDLGMPMGILALALPILYFIGAWKNLLKKEDATQT